MKSRESKLKEETYFVKGMHCASCELLIEKRLLEEDGIEAVEASVNKGEVRVEYKGKKPTLERLNRIFGRNAYTFYDEPLGKEQNNFLVRFNKQGKLIINKRKFYNLLTIVGVSLAVVLVFLTLNKLGLSALISVNSQSALPAFFLFGILAGFSTCSALIGGIVLSMSKQWAEIYPTTDSSIEKLQPHFLFNSGRLISYFFLGALLGFIGGALQITPSFTAILTLTVSAVMIFLGLQMLGMKALQRVQFTMPKFITRFVADEKNFKTRWMPLVMGAFTFFLPCGFTITSQGLALTSGNPLQASLIMLFFALGTLPALLLIGFSSVKFGQKPHFADQFLKIAGVLVLFFALYNINSQLNVLGLKSLSDLHFTKAVVSEDGLAPIVGGKQILRTDALAYGYEPARLRVRLGIPVRWEITDKGTSGCTNAIISRGLFDGQIDLTSGTTSIKEFTPQKVGRYKFSCWMGMVSGVIDVVDPKATSGQVQNSDLGGFSEEIPSGARGCGCSGGCGNPGCPYAR